MIEMDIYKSKNDFAGYQSIVASWCVRQFILSTCSAKSVALVIAVVSVLCSWTVVAGSLTLNGGNYSGEIVFSDGSVILDDNEIINPPILINMPPSPLDQLTNGNPNLDLNGLILGGTITGDISFDPGTPLLSSTRIVPEPSQIPGVVPPSPNPEDYVIKPGYFTVAGFDGKFEVLPGDRLPFRLNDVSFQVLIPNSGLLIVGGGRVYNLDGELIDFTGTGYVDENDVVIPITDLSFDPADSINNVRYGIGEDLIETWTLPSYALIIPAPGPAFAGGLGLLALAMRRRR